MTRTRRKIPGPNITRDTYGHRIIDGYTYMGGNRVPPFPNRLALTDRVTGLPMVLTHTGTSPSLTFAVTPVLPTWSDVTTYGKYDGPYFEQYRIYLSGGTLAAEYAVGYGSQTILTRRGFDNTVLKITINPVSGAVVYTEYDL